MFKKRLVEQLEKAKKNGVSATSIAEKLGVQRSAVSNWRNGRTSPDLDTVKKLAEIFGVSVDYLLGEDELPADGEAMFYIPILGTVPAGDPLEVVEYHEDSFPIPRKLKKLVDFGLKVKGNSMIGAGIIEGDIVFVKCNPEAHNKQIVVATIDGEATIKRFYKSGDTIILKPENNDFEPILISPKSSFRLVGTITSLYRQQIK
jgi:repressor LexA